MNESMIHDILQAALSAHEFDRDNANDIATRHGREPLDVHYEIRKLRELLRKDQTK